MIKINLLAEKKQAKAKKGPARVKSDGGLGAGQNVILIAILLIGVVAAGFWWYRLSNDLEELRVKHADADRELKRLEEIRRKGEEYKAQKELLIKKIDLITELKKRQTVPVHILDKVSKHLPDFLWLESMSADKNKVSISGKATNYNAVSSFYKNLTDSGFFEDVTLGRTFEVREGVSFSLSCQFAQSSVTESTDQVGG